jgi:hypothetical protein
MLLTARRLVAGIGIGPQRAYILRGAARSSGRRSDLDDDFTQASGFDQRVSRVQTSRRKGLLVKEWL